MVAPVEVIAEAATPEIVGGVVSGGGVKVAVITVGVVMVTVQVLVPEQPPPLQPVNEEPPTGLAVSVTGVPLGSEAEHVAPQLIPFGLEATVPLPVPALLTESVFDPATALSVSPETVPEPKFAT